MIIIENAVLSDDIKDEHFVCDLHACKGACCVEGELGAPLSKEETKILDKEMENIKPFLSKEGIEAIEKEGSYILDHEDDYSTTTINGKECAFAIYEKNGTLKCGIEKAHEEGKTSFQKPISCHLYPIRITQYDHYDALNYHRWDICSAACTLGQKLKIPIYKFLKGPLIRKYGEAWYDQLCEHIESNK